MGVLMFQTYTEKSSVLWINAELTIVSSLKHRNTQPIYIFNRENPQDSEPQNGPRRGLDFIALPCPAQGRGWPQRAWFDLAGWPAGQSTGGISLPVVILYRSCSAYLCNIVMHDMYIYPLLIFTWVLKNQVVKINFDELDF